MKRQCLIFLSAIILVSLDGYSQVLWKRLRYEVIGGAGMSNFFGDIGGSADKNNLWGLKDIGVSNAGTAFFVGARYKLKQNMALKLNIFYARVGGNDKNSRNAERGFSFKTSIIEPSLQYEYYIKCDELRYLSPTHLYNRRGMINNYAQIGIYLFAGVGGVLYYPKVFYSVRPANPAYETVSGYSKFTVGVPFGIGIKKAMDKYWSIGFEFGRRIVFSDYLDGLSTSFSKHYDLYYFGVFHLIYKLETDRKGVPYIFRRYKYLGG
jgi:hypothetical protein